MTKKVIPFPQAVPTVPPSVVAPMNRIILNIGKQCFALDISCRARMLNPASAPMVEAPALVNGPGGKIRKPKP